MKLSEGQAFKLFDKHGIKHPKILVKPFDSTQGLTVVKADAPVGGKMKRGLVKICTADQIQDTSDEIQVKMQELGIAGTENGVVVEEFVPHEAEFFVAIRPDRSGIRIFFSDKGGVDVESGWERVRNYLISTERAVKIDWPLEELAELVQPGMLLTFLEELLNFFMWEDASYLEINPMAMTKDFHPVALGVVLELDEAAEFRHTDWAELGIGSRESGKTERERKVKEVDSQIKGSVKLVEIPGVLRAAGGKALTAMMGGGAGAALFLCDAVIENGLKLANYAEFSGNPPNWALTELTRQVCAIPGIKNLVIGSGIANFTDVKNNIEAIIEGLQQSPQAKALNIVVRRCGPGEEEGTKLVCEFAKDTKYKIQVFGRETGMTEIVKKLKDRD